MIWRQLWIYVCWQFCQNSICPSFSFTPFASSALIPFHMSCKDTVFMLFAIMCIFIFDKFPLSPVHKRRVIVQEEVTHEISRHLKSLRSSLWKTSIPNHLINKSLTDQSFMILWVSNDAVSDGYRTVSNKWIGTDWMVSGWGEAPLNGANNRRNKALVNQKGKIES